MVLIVHHLQVSQSERVPWLCEELGINYTLQNYKRSPLLAPPEYKALHYTGTAPIIQDGDATIGESGACLEYIANRYGGGKFILDPKDPAYADYLYWWHWANGSFQPLVSRIMAGQIAGTSKDDMLLKNTMDRFAANLQALDSRLAGNEWLAGKEFTLADIMLVFSLSTMRNFATYSLADYPNILKYLERISKREGYQRALKKSDPDMEPSLGAEPPVNFIKAVQQKLAAA